MSIKNYCYLEDEMFSSDKWNEYELIDAGDFRRLERWGKHILDRPDPKAIWGKEANSSWQNANCVYNRNNSGGGSWDFLSDVPSEWTINYCNLKFFVKPTGFKHTGLFPEQAVNWDWVGKRVRNGSRVLNLFAYTGAASISACKAGAQVCHVDAARGIVEWAKRNAALSGVARDGIRYIVDDVSKFVAREIKRNNKYDGIIMDPPTYGRGPGAEIWKLEKQIFKLIQMCMRVMSDDPLFFLFNSYTNGLSGAIMKNIMNLTLVRKFGGKLRVGEVVLPCTKSDVLMPCGYSGRWTKDDCKV